MYAHLVRLQSALSRPSRRVGDRVPPHHARLRSATASALSTTRELVDLARWGAHLQLVRFGGLSAYQLYARSLLRGRCDGAEVEREQERKTRCRKAFELSKASNQASKHVIVENTCRFSPVCHSMSPRVCWARDEREARQ